MPTRRETLRHAARLAAMLAASGLGPAAAVAAVAQAGAYNVAAFEARTLAEVMKAWGAALPGESAAVSITAPDVAENGAAVPVSLATTLPGARRLLLMVEKNPAMLSAMFDLNDEIEANFATRIKMNESCRVYAVALMTDGAAFFASKDVQVILGGCAA